MKVINTSARLLVAGDVRFIPLTPVACDFAELKKSYPDLADYEKDGILKCVTEAEAKKAEADLEAKTVAMLRNIANKKGIDTKGMKKADIIKALKED